MHSFSSFGGLKQQDISVDSSEFKSSKDAYNLLLEDENAFNKENIVPEIFSTSVQESFSLSGSWKFNPHLSITPPSSYFTNLSSTNPSFHKHNTSNKSFSSQNSFNKITILNNSVKISSANSEKTDIQRKNDLFQLTKSNPNYIDVKKHKKKCFDKTSKHHKISFSKYASYKSEVLGTLDGNNPTRPSFGMIITTPPSKKPPYHLRMLLVEDEETEKAGLKNKNENDLKVTSFLNENINQEFDFFHPPNTEIKNDSSSTTQFTNPSKKSVLLEKITSENQTSIQKSCSAEENVTKTSNKLKSCEMNFPLDEAAYKFNTTKYSFNNLLKESYGDLSNIDLAVSTKDTTSKSSSDVSFCSSEYLSLKNDNNNNQQNSTNLNGEHYSTDQGSMLFGVTPCRQLSAITEASFETEKTLRSRPLSSLDHCIKNQSNYRSLSHGIDFKNKVISCQTNKYTKNLENDNIINDFNSNKTNNNDKINGNNKKNFNNSIQIKNVSNSENESLLNTKSTTATDSSTTCNTKPSSNPSCNSKKDNNNNNNDNDINNNVLTYTNAPQEAFILQWLHNLDHQLGNEYKGRMMDISKNEDLDANPMSHNLQGNKEIDDTKDYRFKSGVIGQSKEFDFSYGDQYYRGAGEVAFNDSHCLSVLKIPSSVDSSLLTKYMDIKINNNDNLINNNLMINNPHNNNIVNINMKDNVNKDNNTIKNKIRKSSNGNNKDESTGNEVDRKGSTSEANEDHYKRQRIGISENQKKPKRKIAKSSSNNNDAGYNENNSYHKNNNKNKEITDDNNDKTKGLRDKNIVKVHEGNHIENSRPNGPTHKKINDKYSKQAYNADGLKVSGTEKIYDNNTKNQTKIKNINNNNNNNNKCKYNGFDSELKSKNEDVIEGVIRDSKESSPNKSLTVTSLGTNGKEMRRHENSGDVNNNNNNNNKDNNDEECISVNYNSKTSSKDNASIESINRCKNTAQKNNSSGNGKNFNSDSKGFTKSLILPSELTFKKVCCLGLSTSTTLHITNVADVWLKVELKIKEVLLDGEVDNDLEECFYFKNKLLLEGNTQEEVKVVFMPQKEGRYSAKMVVSTRFVLANYIYDDNEGKVVEGKRGDMMEGGIWSKEYPANIDVIAIAEKPLITLKDLNESETDTSNNSFTNINYENNKVGEVYKKNILSFGTIANNIEVIKSVVLSNNGNSHVPIRLILKNGNGFSDGFTFKTVSIKSFTPSNYISLSNQSTHGNIKEPTHDNKIIRLILPPHHHAIIRVSFKAPRHITGSVDSHKCLMEVRVDRFDGGILMTVIKLVCMVARVLLGPPSIKVLNFNAASIKQIVSMTNDSLIPLSIQLKSLHPSFISIHPSIIIVLPYKRFSFEVQCSMQELDKYVEKKANIYVIESDVSLIISPTGEEYKFKVFIHNKKNKKNDNTNNNEDINNANNRNVNNNNNDNIKISKKTQSKNSMKNKKNNQTVQVNNKPQTSKNDHKDKKKVLINKINNRENINNNQNTPNNNKMHKTTHNTHTTTNNRHTSTTVATLSLQSPCCHSTEWAQLGRNAFKLSLVSSKAQTLVEEVLLLRNLSTTSPTIVTINPSSSVISSNLTSTNMLENTSSSKHDTFDIRPRRAFIDASDNIKLQVKFKRSDSIAMYCQRWKVVCEGGVHCQVINLDLTGQVEGWMHGNTLASIVNNEELHPHEAIDRR